MILFLSWYISLTINIDVTNVNPDIVNNPVQIATNNDSPIIVNIKISPIPVTVSMLHITIVKSVNQNVDIIFCLVLLLIDWHFFKSTPQGIKAIFSLSILTFNNF